MSKVLTCFTTRKVLALRVPKYLRTRTKVQILTPEEHEEFAECVPEDATDPLQHHGRGYMGGCPPPPQRGGRQAPHRNGTEARHRGRGRGGQDGGQHRAATCHRRSLLIHTHHTVPGQHTHTHTQCPGKAERAAAHGSCLSYVSSLVSMCEHVPSVVCMCETTQLSSQASSQASTAACRCRYWRLPLFILEAAVVSTLPAVVPVVFPALAAVVTALVSGSSSTLPPLLLSASSPTLL